MNNILSFPTKDQFPTKDEPKPCLCFTFGTFGPTQTNCFRDFQKCVKAAMDVQIPCHEGDDMYIFEGTARKIICIITFQGVEFTESGRQFLISRGIEAA